MINTSAADLESARRRQSELLVAGAEQPVDLVQAAPSAWAHIVAVSNHILAGEMYKALKSAKALIAYEKELIDHATRGTGLRRGRQTDRKSA